MEQKGNGRLTELKPKKGIVIEVALNDYFSVWEVVMDGTLMGTFETEEEAARCSESIHLAFETGYINGLLLGYRNKEEAKVALEDRGISFSKVFRFDD